MEDSNLNPTWMNMTPQSEGGENTSRTFWNFFKPAKPQSSGRPSPQSLHDNCMMPSKSACNTPDLRGGPHHKILVDPLVDASAPTPNVHNFGILGDDGNLHTQQQMLSGSGARRSRDATTPMRALTVANGGHGTPSNVVTSPMVSADLATGLMVPTNTQEHTTTNAQAQVKRDREVRAFGHQSPVGVSGVDLHHQTINSIVQQAGANHYLTTLKDEDTHNVVPGTNSNTSATSHLTHHQQQTQQQTIVQHHHLAQSSHHHHHHHHHMIQQQQQVQDVADYSLLHHQSSLDDEESVLANAANGTAGRGRSLRAKALSARYQQMQQQQQQQQQQHMQHYELEGASDQELDMEEFPPHHGGRRAGNNVRRSAPKKSAVRRTMPMPHVLQQQQSQQAQQSLMVAQQQALGVNNGMMGGANDMGGALPGPNGEYDVFDLRPRFEVQYTKGIHLRLGEQGRRILKSLVQNKMHSDGEFRNWVRTQYCRVKCMTVVQLLAVAHEAGLWDAAVALAQQFARSKGSDLLRADPGVDEMEDGSGFDMTGTNAGFPASAAGAAPNLAMFPHYHSQQHPQHNLALLMQQAAVNPAFASLLTNQMVYAQQFGMPHFFANPQVAGAGLEFNPAFMSMQQQHAAVFAQQQQQAIARSQKLAAAAANEVHSSQPSNNPVMDGSVSSNSSAPSQPAPQTLSAQSEAQTTVPAGTVRSVTSNDLSESRSAGNPTPVKGI
eukprot:GDKK01036293.1.p1 GENE.GDKK01036293.1~~GDKK01036293.1.p1  ORF type:complete len:721 (-),score=185.18 GDKK01036293.1:36-2198(-)